MDDARLRVCLEREIELPGVRLRFRDWPGRGRPIVHFAFSQHAFDADFATAIAPEHRVLSLAARLDVPYQTSADDLASFLGAFGFDGPLLLGEGPGAIVPLLVAAWQPALVGGVLLAGPGSDPVDALATRSLRDCPPDWNALLRSVGCPLDRLEHLSVAAVETFLGTIERA